MVGRTGNDFVQEHHVALPFFHSHRGVVQTFKPCRQRGQLVEMRREQRAAFVDVMQMFDRRPGDRQAVEGRGAAANLVEDHQ